MRFLEWAANFNIFLVTTAPESYDWGYTVNVTPTIFDWNNLPDDGNADARVVMIGGETEKAREINEQNQTGRYSSGVYLTRAATPEELSAALDILAKRLHTVV